METEKFLAVIRALHDLQTAINIPKLPYDASSSSQTNNAEFPCTQDFQSEIQSFSRCLPSGYYMPQPVLDTFLGLRGHS